MVKIFIVLFALIYIIATIIGFKILKARDYKKNNFYAGYKEKNGKLTYKVYNILYRIPISRVYIENLHKQLSLYSPGNQLLNKKRTLYMSLFIWGISAIEISFIFLRQPTFLNAISTIILVYIVNAEIIYFYVMRTEVRLLKQMVKFFEDVRHYYYDHQNIDLAILDAIKNTEKEIRAHASLLYDVLNSDDIDKSVRNYNETVHINHLKLFLSACLQVKTYGDKERDEYSIFQMNLHHLKNEVNNEMLKYNKLIYIFSGKIFMTVCPLLTLNYLKSFGVSTLPEMISFYEGTIGLTILIISIVIIVMCYILQTYQRDVSNRISSNGYILFLISNFYPIRVILDNYTDRYYTNVLRLKEKLKQTGEKISYRQFMIKQFLFSILTFIFVILLIFQLHEIKKNRITGSAEEINKIATGVTDKQLDSMKESVINYVDKYKDEVDITELAIKRTINNEVKIKNPIIKEAIAELVLEKINEYRQEYFKWYELVSAIVIAIVAYYVPYLILTYRYNIARKGMDQEVIQFQSIILMLMYLDNISVLTILEVMEMFSVIFKSSLQECINSFNAGSEEALLKLKENEKFEAFSRLVDNLIISDKIGIVKAFDEIASERIHFLEKRKQENDIELNKKSDNSTIIAYVPIMFIFILYLAVPFTIKCVADYQSIVKTMDGF